MSGGPRHLTGEPSDVNAEFLNVPIPGDVRRSARHGVQLTNIRQHVGLDLVAFNELVGHVEQAHD